MSQLIACDECGDRETEMGWTEDDVTWVCDRCERLLRGGLPLTGIEKAGIAWMTDLVIPPENGVPFEADDVMGTMVYSDDGLVDYAQIPNDLLVV